MPKRTKLSKGGRKEGRGGEERIIREWRVWEKWDAGIGGEGEIRQEEMKRGTNHEIVASEASWHPFGGSQDAPEGCFPGISQV